jgi:hypothetical protein
MVLYENTLQLHDMHYRDFYTFSLEYLQSIAKNRGIAPTELNRYFTPNNNIELMNKQFPSIVFHSMNDIQFIMCRLFLSMQNSGYRNFVKLDEQAGTFAELLCDFMPKIVLEKYPSKKDFLLDAMTKTTELSIDENNRKAWYDFFDGVYDSVKMLSPFSDAEDIRNKTTTPNSLNPANEIISFLLEKPKPKGLGPALAADFVKESGLADGGKPDVHILKVLHGIHAIDDENDFNGAFEVLKKIADANSNSNEKVTMYKIDKIIWLICTKKFYLHDSEDDRTTYIKMLNEKLYRQ